MPQTSSLPKIPYSCIYASLSSIINLNISLGQLLQVLYITSHGRLFTSFFLMSLPFSHQKFFLSVVSAFEGILYQNSSSLFECMLSISPIVSTVFQKSSVVRDIHYINTTWCMLGILYAAEKQIYEGFFQMSEIQVASII